MSDTPKIDPDGGPAFPQEEWSGYMTNYDAEKNLTKYSGGHPGMSLRDHFAGLALQAIVSQAKINKCGDFVADDCLLQHVNAPRYAAATAYAFADAMLAERAKAATL
jgi:hypothetical protein